MWNAEGAQEREQCRLEGAVVDAAKALVAAQAAYLENADSYDHWYWCTLNKARELLTQCVQKLERAERGEWE